WGSSAAPAAAGSVPEISLSSTSASPGAARRRISATEGRPSAQSTLAFPTLCCVPMKALCQKALTGECSEQQKRNSLCLSRLVQCQLATETEARKRGENGQTEAVHRGRRL